MTSGLLDRIADILGRDAVVSDIADLPIVAPRDTEGVATLVAAARRHGFVVVPVGSGRDIRVRRDPRPAVALSTRRLNRVVAHEAGDLTLTVETGRRSPTSRERSGGLGSSWPSTRGTKPQRSAGLSPSLATGPSAGRCGPVRDQVLGMTVVNGDGRITEVRRSRRQERDGLRSRAALRRQPRDPLRDDGSHAASATSSRHPHGARGGFPFIHGRLRIGATPPPAHCRHHDPPCRCGNRRIAVFGGALARRRRGTFRRRARDDRPHFAGSRGRLVAIGSRPSSDMDGAARRRVAPRHHGSPCDMVDARPRGRRSSEPLARGSTTCFAPSGSSVSMRRRRMHRSPRSTF
jgi:hypothetical protein